MIDNLRLIAYPLKITAEISQVLKKVEEGVLLFDDIWEKVTVLYDEDNDSLVSVCRQHLIRKLHPGIRCWSAEFKGKI